MSRRSVSDEDKQKANTFVLKFLAGHPEKKKAKDVIELFKEKYPNVKVDKSFENYFKKEYKRLLNINLGSPFKVRDIKEVKSIRKCIKYLRQHGHKLKRSSIRSRSSPRLKFKDNNRIRVFEDDKILKDNGLSSPRRSVYKSVLKRKSGKKVYFRNSSSPRKMKKSCGCKSKKKKH